MKVSAVKAFLFLWRLVALVLVMQDEEGRQGVLAAAQEEGRRQWWMAPPIVMSFNCKLLSVIWVFCHQYLDEMLEDLETGLPRINSGESWVDSPGTDWNGSGSPTAMFHRWNRYLCVSGTRLTIQKRWGLESSSSNEDMTKVRLTSVEKWHKRQFSKGMYFRAFGTYKNTNSMTKGDQNWIKNLILVFWLEDD